jgi:hypothetical protein
VLAKHEQQMALLHLANQFPPHGGAFDSALDQAIIHGQEHLLALRNKLGSPIARRRRPSSTSVTGSRVTIYLDECGSHSVGSPDPFGAFALAAVIVSEADQGVFDKLWRQWKQGSFNNPDAMIHEPDVRHAKRHFFCKGDAARQQEVLDGLAETIQKAPFHAIVCVLNRSDYRQQFGDGQMDASLPPHMYLMMLDFIVERIAIVLDTEFGGARARFVAESRESREDALLQFEFARLHLEGTSYLSDSWFRRQMEPGIEFKSKMDKINGLQLADLVARPCAEKVISPSSDPPRWQQIRPKLCSGRETAHSILGLKVVPWDSKYDRIWES